MADIDNEFAEIDNLLADMDLGKEEIKQNAPTD